MFMLLMELCIIDKLLTNGRGTVMPLKKGKKNIGKNIKEELKSGKSKAQSVAIALNVARKSGVKIPRVKTIIATFNYTEIYSVINTAPAKPAAPAASAPFPATDAPDPPQPYCVELGTLPADDPLAVAVV